MFAKLNSLIHLSQAARVTLCYFFALLGLTLVAWCMYQFDVRRVAWADYMTLGRLALLLGMLIASSIAVYWTAKFWFEEAAVSEDEVQSAWMSGLRALNRMGIHLQDLPLFLMIGCSGRQQQRQILSMGDEVVVLETPQIGDSSVNWFVTDRAIYVCCSRLGVLGPTLKKLEQRFQQLAVDRKHFGRDAVVLSSAEELAAAESNSAALEDRRVERTEMAVSATRHGSMHSETGSSNTAVAIQSKSDPAANAANTQEEVEPSTIQKTETSLSKVEELVAQAVQSQAFSTPRLGSEVDDSEPIVHSTEVLQGQRDLLQLATQIRSSRRPTAPVNGLSVFVNLDVIQTEAAARHCGRAIRQDLGLLESVFGMHMPVSLVLSGGEKQLGICELIRRLGQSSAARQKLGEGCDPRAELSHEALQGFIRRSMGTIANCIYAMFRDRDALTQPRNAELVQLLLASRGHIAHVSQVLSKEAFEDRIGKVSRPTFLSGLFLVADGDTARQQGFAVPLLNSIYAQQQYLEWSQTELRARARTSLASYSLVGFCLANLAIFVWQVINS